MSLKNTLTMQLMVSLCRKKVFVFSGSLGTPKRRILAPDTLTPPQKKAKLTLSSSSATATRRSGAATRASARLLNEQTEEVGYCRPYIR